MSDFPAPLSPPECDLRGYDFMPLFGHRLFSSELYDRASAEEFRVALKLWWVAWQQCPAGSLPDDDVALWRYAGTSGRKWLRLRTMALHGFIKCSDGRLYHPLIAEQAILAWEGRKAMRDRFAYVADRRSEITAEQWMELRNATFIRDNFTCQYCGERGGKLECDHVVPVARGGSHELSNLTTACFTCNRAKGTKTVDEWRRA